MQPTSSPLPLARWVGLAKLILGSKSWSRRTLLSELQVPRFEIAVPDIDESLIRNSSARDLVLAIGHAKAQAILSRGDITPAPPEQGKTLLICGDSVVVHKGCILEKPSSEEEAREFLRSYATGPATTVSSVIVVDVTEGRTWEGVDEAEVYFREMPDEVVEELVKRGGAMESAGGLRIEHSLAVKYTECIIGHRSAVMGFSLPLVECLIRDALEGNGGKFSE